MAERSGVRVSDQERDDAARQLREHFTAGRLTQEELDERLAATYGARTEDQLRALLVDLPQLPITPQQHKAELAARRSQLQRRLLQQTGGSLGVFVLCAVIWVASGAHSPFWPVWVAIFPALTLLRNGWRLYGPSPELDRVERELDRRARQSERQAKRHSHRHRHRL